MTTVHLLAVGDIHLGRRPARLPDDLEDHGRQPHDLGPRAALTGLVEEARRRRVAAVLLAGDVVDAANRFFEAVGPLEEAVRALTASSIEVIAVAGNHDGDVLPRLARAVPGFTLLGAGGRWETHDIVVDGRAVATIVGWSFPAASHREDPLAGFPESLPDDRPVIGLLHADLDASDSPYAPVARGQLEARRPDAWLLGHLHAPGELSRGRPIGYLGTLVGLDPTETGRRGPWLVDLGPGREVRLTHLPRAPLRWETIHLDAARLLSREALEDAIVSSLSSLHERLADEGELATTRAVGVRVLVGGRGARVAELEAAARDGAGSALRRTRDNVLYFIDRVAVEARPAFDLEELAASDDPPGLVARRLRQLESGDREPVVELLERTRARLEDVARSGPWRELPAPLIDDEVARRALLADGYRILERLLAARDVS